MKDSLGNAARKKLADISNIPEQMRINNQNEKSETMSICSKEFVDKVQKVRALSMLCYAFTLFTCYFFF